MVKTYLRYEQHSSFGVISSANALFGSKGKLAITATLEDITLWNIRQGVKVQTLHHNTIKGHVTYLALSPDSVVLAAGYSDGTVCLWDYQIAAGENAARSSMATPLPTAVFRTMLSGHRSEITALSFSTDGATLVSGSTDTELIVWDVLAEKGTMKLSGHRNAITCCKILDEDGKVISGARDGMVKVWDLDTQRCVQTLVGHHNPVWALAVSPDRTTLVTGSLDKMIRIWKLGTSASEFAIKKEENVDEEEEEVANEEQYAQFFGTITRSSVYKDHVGSLEFNNAGTLLACQGSETTLDIFTVFSKEEVDEKRIVKMEDEDERPKGYSPLDFFVPLENLTTTEKIKSFSFDSHTPTRQFMLSLGNNSVQVYKLGAQTQDMEEEQRNEGTKVQSEVFGSLEFEGHPSDIRFVALSYDDTQILSVSTNCAKIFSSKLRKVTRTILIENAICGSFVPGDKHVVIGTKIGKLFVVELASGVIVEVEGAHASVLWSVCIFPNGQGLATASADKTVKFWAFEMKQNGNLSLALVKTLQVESEATCVCISPNSKHVAVSLMDYTVAIFSMSTFKKFLSLYGHKLPVLSISISSDSALIATASADKNIKIWGMDFGDCHKSIFAHDGSVTQIAFVPNTHYLFTTGKDKLVKYWDADKFEHIQTLKGHHSEVWGLAVSSSGRFVVSSSHDRSIRIWEQTDEQLFLDEERENEQDAMFEEALLEDRPVDPDDPTAPRGVETTRPSRVTTEAIKGSERMLEALQFLENPESTLAVATLRGRTPEDYVFHTISTLRAADVEEALLLLPYAQLEPMLIVLDLQASKANMRTLETLCRTVFFLLSIHQKQLTLDTKLLPRLISLNERVKGALNGYKRVVGVNRAAMGLLQQELENTEEGYIPLFKIQELREMKQRKHNKNKRSKQHNK